MKRISKILSIIALCGTMGLAGFGLVGCKEEPSNAEISNVDIYNKYVVYAQENGVETMSYEEWLEEIKTLIKGEKGDQGEKGQDGLGIKDITINNIGELIITWSNDVSENLGAINKGIIDTQTITFDLNLPKELCFVEDEIRSLFANYKQVGDLYESKIENYTLLENFESVELINNTHLSDYFLGWYNGNVLMDKTTFANNEQLEENPSFIAKWDENNIKKYAGNKELFLNEDNNKLYVSGNNTNKIIRLPQYYFYNGEDLLIESVYYTNYPNTVEEFYLPESVKGIYFRGCNSLRYVIYESTNLNIPDNCFNGCENLKGVSFGVKQDGLNLTNITSIGAFSFKDCKSITSLFIGKDVASIRDGAFEGCSELDNIQVDKENITFKKDSRHILNKDTNTLVLRTILGLKSQPWVSGVEKISKYAYSLNYENVTNIGINEDVKSIEDGCFEKCINLKIIRSLESQEILNSLIAEDSAGGLLKYAEVIYIDSDLDTTTATYLKDNFIIDVEYDNVTYGEYKWIRK